VICKSINRIFFSITTFLCESVLIFVLFSTLFFSAFQPRHPSYIYSPTYKKVHIKNIFWCAHITFYYVLQITHILLLIFLNCYSHHFYHQNFYFFSLIHLSTYLQLLHIHPVVDILLPIFDETLIHNLIWKLCALCVYFLI
jgi:hypothetical protein